MLSRGEMPIIQGRHTGLKKQKSAAAGGNHGWKALCNSKQNQAAGAATEGFFAIAR
ncbi:hypothetical protein GGD46_000043 [Rhizobium lusitanum]|uniref:Uncharacterized protein n=1 Tax=Rhizobium lusitanum TaxID=293958 RepID=A0A7X0MBE8_9HYPH|nr:hypothetical protein [Rhizobium lusitanum]